MNPSRSNVAVSFTFAQIYTRTLMGYSRSAKAKNRRRHQIRFVLFALTDWTEICLGSHYLSLSVIASESLE